MLTFYIPRAKGPEGRTTPLVTTSGIFRLAHSCFWEVRLLKTKAAADGQEPEFPFTPAVCCGGLLSPASSGRKRPYENSVPVNVLHGTQESLEWLSMCCCVVQMDFFECNIIPVRFIFQLYGRAMWTDGGQGGSLLKGHLQFKVLLQDKGSFSLSLLKLWCNAVIALNVHGEVKQDYENIIGIVNTLGEKPCETRPSTYMSAKLWVLYVGEVRIYSEAVK